MPNEAEVNSAVTYQLHVGSTTDRPLRAALQLFAQIASEPAFNELRTKQQLGYIIFSGVTGAIGSMGFRVLIQSERDPIYLETRIEAFLDSLKEYIDEMSEEEFEKNKQSIIAKKEEKPKNLGEETRQFSASIHDRYYEFGKRESEKHLEGCLTKETRSNRCEPSSKYDKARHP